MSNDETVLVTGGTGYLGAHAIVQLLQAGYQVRTTLRSDKREPDVRAMVAAGGAIDPVDKLSFAVADLTADDGWKAAVAGCDYVLHMASPFPAGRPADEDELIVPARDGVLRVLRAARDSGVRRVVVTSSFAAIGYGHPPTDRPFTEETWTNLDDRALAPYVKSKTIAERAAWDFLARQGEDLELSVINPTGIFGPVLGPDYSSSIQIVAGLLTGTTRHLPGISFGVVDVRDVADAHLKAMTNVDAAGERYIATAGLMSLKEVADTLRARLGDDAKVVPTRATPDWLIRLAALRNPQARQIIPDLGKARRSDPAKARTQLGWTPRPAADTIVDTAQSLLRLGLLKPAA